jgi:hypothetical protein
VDKQNAPADGIYLALKRKGIHSDACYHMGVPVRHYATGNNPVTKEQILYKSTYLRYLE